MPPSSAAHDAGRFPVFKCVRLLFRLSVAFFPFFFFAEYIILKTSLCPAFVRGQRAGGQMGVHLNLRACVDALPRSRSKEFAKNISEYNKKLKRMFLKIRYLNLKHHNLILEMVSQ